MSSDGSLESSNQSHSEYIIKLLCWQARENNLERGQKLDNKTTDLRFELSSIFYASTSFACGLPRKSDSCDFVSFS